MSSSILMSAAAFFVALCLARLSAVATASPDSWMRESLSIIASKSLRQISIPGSHDAGMSVLGSHTAFSNKENTLTQTVDIAGQLRLGVRWFDLRPVISGGQFFTGHCSEIALKQWQGGDGESFDSIIDALNGFTNSTGYGELILVSLTHAYNTDVRRRDTDGELVSTYRSFTTDEWLSLFERLMAVNNRFEGSVGADLTRLPVADFVGNGRSAIVFFAETNNLGQFAGHGVFPFPQMFDSYADTDNLDKMTTDQLDKMHSNCGLSWFLLSWTLTQKAVDVVDGQSIIKLANKANTVLLERLVPAVNATCIPNIIHIDNVHDTTAVDLAISFNTKYL